MNFDTKIALLETRKKQLIVDLLDQFCQQIEITSSQYEKAKVAYEAVGFWLAESDLSYFDEVQIYSQGSVALGTAVKPLMSCEFDVDLICHLPMLSHTSAAHLVKSLIGNRLKEHKTYKNMLEEKARCWRINYANEFHLDITPSIVNPHCYQGGELVPDRTLAQWKPTNPRGYIKKFDQYAAIRPHFYLEEEKYRKLAHDSVEPLPEQTMSKPLLKRIVQLLKCHRNRMFMDTTRENMAPISVIITTLAGRAYAKCARQQVHADAFDFITAVIREMPTYIHIESGPGRREYVIENETAMGENFAEKWNSDEQLAKAFYEWHTDVLEAVESLLQIEGTDKFADSLNRKFGAKKEHIREILTGITNPIGQARSTGLLSIVPTIGLVTSPTSESAVVPRNTFYGRAASK